MFIAFATGARVIIVPDSVKLVPSKLCQILFDEEKVTVLQVRAMDNVKGTVKFFLTQIHRTAYQSNKNYLKLSLLYEN